jgi:hypothetical protein
MAKTETAAVEAPAVEALAAEAAPAAKAKNSRAVTLTKVPEGVTHPIDTSEENLKKLAAGKVKSQPRAEFIREMWKTTNYTRSQIRDMCQVFGDDPEMKYQIVFQATKDVEGGPAPTAAAPAAAAGAAKAEGATEAAE